VTKEPRFILSSFAKGLLSPQHFDIVANCYEQVPMHCLLFRHGIAESPGKWGDEFTRPLTQEGITKTQHAIEGLHRIGIQPTHLLCSPLTRTQQTAAILKDLLSVPNDIQTVPELVYDQSPRLLFSILQACPPHACVVCVGHEPHLGQTASLMVFGDHSNGLSVKKAGACLISFSANVAVGKGRLEWWIPPAQLWTLRKG